MSNTLHKAISNTTALIQDSSLKGRCARSGIVLGIGAFIAKFLGFGSKVILTRLLVPQEMGLMVMIISLTQLFEALTEIGIKQSVIQHKNGADPEYLNMAWWFQVLRGIGLYAVAFIVAPWLCEFYFHSKPDILTRYSMKELTTLVQVAFLCILFNGFVSPRAHVLEKKFRFGRAVVITQGSFVLGTIVTIILAFLIRNVWAIVIGFAATGFTRCLMSHVLCPFIPRFVFHSESFHGLYHFAKGMFGLPLLTYIVFNIDILVAGKLVSADLLGMYGMALVLARAPQDFFNRIVNPLLLPAFAEKQDNMSFIRNSVLQATKIIALFALPLVGLAIIWRKSLLSLVYGKEYSAVAVPFSLMCIYVLLQIQTTVLVSLIYAIGQPARNRFYIGIKTLVIVLLIFPAVKLFGLSGAAALLLFAEIIAYSFQVAIIRKIFGLSVRKYLLSWLQGLVLTFLIFIIIKFLVF